MVYFLNIDLLIFLIIKVFFFLFILLLFIEIELKMVLMIVLIFLIIVFMKFFKINRVIKFVIVELIFNFFWLMFCIVIEGVMVKLNVNNVKILKSKIGIVRIKINKLLINYINMFFIEFLN